MRPTMQMSRRASLLALIHLLLRLGLRRCLHPRYLLVDHPHRDPSSPLHPSSRHLLSLQEAEEEEEEGDNPSSGSVQRGETEDDVYSSSPEPRVPRQ